MTRMRRVAAAALVLASALAMVPLTATTAGAVSAPEVVASGLNNPYKLTFGPDGALYVAEAGTGGEEGGNCVESESEEGEPSTVCLGNTGSVTRIGTSQTRVVTGLPSVGDPETGDALGATDVAFGADGATYVVIGLGADPASRAGFGADGARMGTLMRAPAGSTTASVFADISAFETANNPDQGEEESEIDSNPFGVESVSDGFLVADAGGNDLLHVTTAGTVSLRTVFPFQEAELPPFVGAPPGTKIRMQPVPTAVEVSPTGEIHVSELTGFPFPPGAADVYRVEADGDIAGTIAGFTNIIDIAFAPDGTLYVLEFASNGLLSEQPAPQLVQVRTDGTRKVLLADYQLGGPPGGVAVGTDGKVYVSVCNVCGEGAGRVIKVDPTVATDAATQAACPPAEVPGTGFLDIARSVHRESIECLRWWELVGGVTASAYAPNDTITRGQAASITAGALEAAGVELPANPPNAFPDDDDSVHSLRIDQLAELDLVNGFADGTFGAGRDVSRAQLVTLLVGAYEVAVGSAPPVGSNAFTDDEGSVHEANINAAAAAGWVAGAGPGRFDPSGTARRGQVASFYARWLSTMVEEEAATLPA
jgi:hypothetical protein